MSAPIYLPPTAPPSRAVRAAEEAMLAAEGPFSVGGVYFANTDDAARARRLAAERAARDAERVAAHAARQRARVRAAAALTCERVGRGRYVVTGGAEPHYVDLAADGAALPLCDCGDAHYRPEFACKHVLAARRADARRRVA